MYLVWAFRHVYWFQPSRYIMALVQWKDCVRTPWKEPDGDWQGPLQSGLANWLADKLTGQLVRVFLCLQLRRRAALVRGKCSMVSKKEMRSKKDHKWEQERARGRGGGVKRRDEQSMVPAICTAVASGSLINTSENLLCPPVSSVSSLLWPGYGTSCRFRQPSLFFYLYSTADLVKGNKIWPLIFNLFF